eukprot:UN04292
MLLYITEFKISVCGKCKILSKKLRFVSSQKPKQYCTCTLNSYLHCFKRIIFGTSGKQLYVILS